MNRFTPRPVITGCALLLCLLGLAPGAEAATPYQEGVIFKLNVGEAVQCQALPVPVGTRLTVNFASISIQASTSGQQLTGVYLFTQLAGRPEVFNTLPVTLLGPTTFQGAQTMTAYADVGTNPRLCVGRSTTTGALDVYGSVNGATNP